MESKVIYFNYSKFQYKISLEKEQYSGITRNNDIILKGMFTYFENKDFLI